jgi:hypothetical protein
LVVRKYEILNGMSNKAIDNNQARAYRSIAYCLLPIAYCLLPIA